MASTVDPSTMIYPAMSANGSPAPQKEKPKRSLFTRILCCLITGTPGDKKDFPTGGLAKRRYCTDCCMVPIFLIMWGGMITVSVFGFMYGNPKA